MSRPQHNPFIISDANASVNYIDEQEARRLRKKWKLSEKNRSEKPPSDGKYVLHLDERTSSFIHEYSASIKADYSSTVKYLLRPLADAYKRDKKKVCFAVEGKWQCRREGSGDLNQDND